MKRRIDVLVNDGSPLGVVLADVYGENGRLGVGGAELALLTLCEGWHNAGHSVRLYNNPTHPNLSPFPQHHLNTFDPKEDRDVLIVFRSPNFRVDGAKGLKVWWSCDQYTVGNFKEFAHRVDKIVTISPFHAHHFSRIYNIEDTITIDLPVRLDDYTGQIEKVPHRMIYCSVPDRGLDVLSRVYPMVKDAIPDASLVITSDYRLWGANHAGNDRHIQRFLGMSGIKFMGAVPRREMVDEQLKAEVQSFPCTYDELFAIAVAECEVAGAYPVTSTQGAVITTNMGKLVGGNSSDPRWAEAYAQELITTMLSDNLSTMQAELQKKSAERFSLERIMKEWEEKVFNG